MVENLQENNVYWTPAQLTMMSNDTFLTCVEVLGAIRGYNAEQLAVLSKKAAQVQTQHDQLVCLGVEDRFRFYPMSSFDENVNVPKVKSI